MIISQMSVNTSSEIHVYGNQSTEEASIRIILGYAYIVNECGCCDDIKHVR